MRLVYINQHFFSHVPDRKDKSPHEFNEAVTKLGSLKSKVGKVPYQQRRRRRNIFCCLADAQTSARIFR